MAGLIIPDVHQQITKLNVVLTEYACVDWVVFLGDWFDSFSHGALTEETARWLRENVSNPKYTFIWGNHDIHYAFPIDPIICTGYTRSKQKIVSAYLRDIPHWKRFKLMHWIDGGNNEWLCSHAGIHPTLLHPIRGYDRDVLQEMEEEAMWKLRYCQMPTSLVVPGKSRGGHARVGGVDWLDWREFEPIEGLNQIVGHTYGEQVRIKETCGSVNYCIDTHFNHVIVMEDGKVRIEEA